MRTSLLLLALAAALLLLRGEAEANAASAYTIAAPVWHVHGSALGGSYQLLGAADTAEDRCCCIYIPCVLR